jgi:hypothetical protein
LRGAWSHDLPQGGSWRFVPTAPLSPSVPRRDRRFFLPCATCQPRHELSQKHHLCSRLCTVRCLLRSQRRLRRCAWVSGICPNLSSSSGDSSDVSVRKYQSRLRPYRSFWRASCNIGPPSPEGLSVLWVTSPPALPSVRKADGRDHTVMQSGTPSSSGE